MSYDQNQEFKKGVQFTLSSLAQLIAVNDRYDRHGYGFTRWLSSDTETGAPKATDLTAKSDVTVIFNLDDVYLSADWGLCSYNITCLTSSLSGSSFAGPYTYDVTQNVKISAPDMTNVKSSNQIRWYKFDNWYRNGTLLSGWDANPSEPTYYTDITDLSAKWNKPQYTITYTFNPSNILTSNIEETLKEEFTVDDLPYAYPTLTFKPGPGVSGYHFTNWNELSIQISDDVGNKSNTANFAFDTYNLYGRQDSNGPILSILNTETGESTSTTTTTESTTITVTYNDTIKIYVKNSNQLIIHDLYLRNTTGEKIIHEFQTSELPQGQGQGGIIEYTLSDQIGDNQTLYVFASYQDDWGEVHYHPGY